MLWTTPQDYYTKIQGRKAAAPSKTKFSLRFLCDFWRTQGCCKTCRAAARLLQGTQGVRTTDVRVRHQRISLTKVVRLPQDQRALYCNAAARMLRNVRPSRFVLRQSCQFCTTILRQPCVGTRDNHTNIMLLPYDLCDSLQIWLRLCRTVSLSVACGKIARTNGRTINVKQAWSVYWPVGVSLTLLLQIWT